MILFSSSAKATDADNSKVSNGAQEALFIRSFVTPTGEVRYLAENFIIPNDGAAISMPRDPIEATPGQSKELTTNEAWIRTKKVTLPAQEGRNLIVARDPLSFSLPSMVLTLPGLFKNVLDKNGAGCL